MQQPPQMIPMMPSFPPQNITTEQIQKFLDENKKLILAILDNQNLGKLAECAEYQAQLQKNLMYLAAIADAQPQGPAAAMPPQHHPATMQQGAYYMQHPQAAAMGQQPGGGFPPRMPVQFNNQHQMQDPQQLHQQAAMHAQMRMRPLGVNNNGMHAMQADTSLGNSGLPPPASGSSGPNKQDASDAGTTGADGQGSSAADGGEEAK
ncbi:GRF1-interacting factor 3 [Linum perenne]